MMTKKFFKKLAFCVLTLGVVTGFAACSNDDEPTAITLPDLNGNLTLSIPDDEIGTGQTFTVSYTLPAQPEGVASRTCALEVIPADGAGKDAQLNGNEFSQLIYLREAGSYTLRLTVSNTLNTPNPDGSTVQLQQIEKKINVISTDALFSFWGESPERTKQNNGQMTLTGETETQLLFSYTSSFAQLNPIGGKLDETVVPFTYYYVDNALDNISETTPCTVSKPGEFVGSVYTWMRVYFNGIENAENRMWKLADNEVAKQCDELFNNWINKLDDMDYLSELGKLLTADGTPSVYFDFTATDGKKFGLTIDFTESIDQCDVTLSWNK